MAAERLDLLDQRPRAACELVGEPLDVVRARERVGRVRHVALLLQDQLRVPRNPRRKIGGQRNRLVQSVRMQRLRPAQHGRQCLDSHPCDVVHRLLGGQRHASRLGMEAQQAGAAAAALLGIAYWVLDPTPPNKVVLATGTEQAQLTAELALALRG